MSLHFSSSGEDNLRKENLSEGNVEEAVRDDNKVVAYDAISDSTIVLGSTDQGKALVVVLEGEDILPQQPAQTHVLAARAASPEEALLYEEHAADARND